MQCPHHDVTLLKSEKFGIEIDYCPQCHGAWFGRGELDKVIEAYRALGLEAMAVRPGRRPEAVRRPVSRKSRTRDAVEDLLEDLFDFD